VTFRQNLEIAQQLYERALVLDSTFALAYASLSNVHGLQYWLGYDPYPERSERQREAAEAAVRLAPRLPQARWAMGIVYYWGERDFARALEELTVAVEGLPGSAELWEYVGFVHRRLGNWDQALAAFEKATALDPRDTGLFYDLAGNTYRFLRRYADAIEAYNRALALAPDLWGVRLSTAWTYLLWRGELDTLRNLLQRGPETFGVEGSRDLWRARLALWKRQPDTVLALLAAPQAVTFEARSTYEPGLLYVAWAQQLRGDRGAATRAFTGTLARLDSALKELPDDWRLHASRGLALAGIGRQSAAQGEAEWLTNSRVWADLYDRGVLSRARAMIWAQAGLVEDAVAEIEPLLAGPSWTSVHTLRLDPRWDPIRYDPRFQALLVKYADPEPVR
jgi:tetratricopeptide (TPR) repeat protein